MLDAPIRQYIDPTLSALGEKIAERGIGADMVTLAGFVIGLGSIPALAFGLHWIALILVLVNRLCDGLDGAVSRASGGSDFGGYLDIVCDFLFYAAVPFGFALADPDHAAFAAFLIFSFVGTGSSFLAYAVMAAKRGITTEIRGQKALYYLGGLTEGTETIAAFVIMCALPQWFPWVAVIFGALCWVTTVTRFLAARREFV